MHRFATLMMATTFSSLALAHGDLLPAHGGLIKEGRATTVELVMQPDGTTVYLSDHGKPVSSSGASGQIVMLDGGKKSTLNLKPASANTLTAAGAAPSSRTRLIVNLTLPGRATEQMRFSFGPSSH